MEHVLYVQQVWFPYRRIHQFSNNFLYFGSHLIELQSTFLGFLPPVNNHEHREYSLSLILDMMLYHKWPTFSNQIDKTQ